MPVALRLLLLSVAVSLAACATAPHRTPSRMPDADFTGGSTPINAPPRKATSAPSPLSSNQVETAPARPQPAAPERVTPPAAASRNIIVMGAPLPGVASPLAPTPATRPLAPEGQAAAPSGLPGAPVAALPPDMAPMPQLPDAPAGQAATMAGPPTGFGGITWGTSARAVPGLAVHDVDAALSDMTYVWPNGPKDVMGAPIEDAYFEFFRDRFYHVWIDVNGMQAYETALAALKATYGPPTAENVEKYYHSWTVGEVNIYCAYHPDERKGDVSFFYQPIYEQLDAARKAAVHARRHPKGAGRS